MTACRIIGGEPFTGAALVTSRRLTHDRSLLLISSLTLASVLACAGEESSRPRTVRLVDAYASAQTSGGPEQDREPRPPTQWRFTEAAASGQPTLGWEAAAGVAGLGVRDGRLAGRTESPLPLLHLETTPNPADHEPLQAVEIRARASAGTRLAVTFAAEEKPVLPAIMGGINGFPWGHSPLTPGDDLQTYTMTSPQPLTAAEVRHIYIRPTDAPGAEFAIESVRLIYRIEQLTEIRSGVSWQGLSEIYRETLVARAPETIRFDVDLPADPWLDLGLGTVTGEPLTFRIALDNGGERSVVLERTVTMPDAWQPIAIDLERWSGRNVALELALEAATEGTIGLWGSPAVRQRGAAPTTAPPAQIAGKGVEPPLGVILIMVDTLRADHLSPWGYERETAPNLQRMADGGVRFADNLAQGTWTKVSAPSLMTSLYPTAHTVAGFYDRLPAAATTLAEVYREAGYATLSLSSVLFTGKFTNLHQGYEELHEQTSLGPVGAKDGEKTARPYLDRLLPWLERHRESPFFVYYHAVDPHDPFEPREPFNTMWLDPAEGKALRADMGRVSEFIQEPLMKLFTMPNRRELERAGIDPETYVTREKGWYDGSIRGFDAELRRLLERLQELGLAERTLIALVSDHGEEFLEHGQTFHGQSVYGELTHVPMLLYWPGVLPAGVVVADTVENLDLMPTLLELSGLAAPAPVQGQSLLPLIAAGGDVAKAQRSGWRARPAIAEKADISTEAGDNVASDALEAYAIVSDGWRLIHNVSNRDERPEYELYDHAADPLNQKNVAAEHPDVVERLGAQLDAWHKATLATRLDRDAQASSLSSEEMERLRALGYL